MRLDDGEKLPREVEIVGVVGDVRHFGLEKEVTIEAYVPIAQVPDQTTIWLANNMYWVLHTDGAPLAVASTVRREIAAVDPAVPASFVRSMDQWMAGTLAPRRFNLQLAAAFAAAALLLAMVGVYAVSAAAVAARRREIGIRAALGASRIEVIALVLRTGLAPVLAGLATGAAVAVLASDALGGMLFGVSPGDPFSLCCRRGNTGRRGRAREPGSGASGRQGRSDCRPARGLKRRCYFILKCARSRVERSALLPDGALRLRARARRWRRSICCRS